MNARRYSRTLDEAFGPYHRSSVCPIEPMQDKRVPSFDLALYLVGVLAAIVLIGVL